MNTLETTDFQIINNAIKQKYKGEYPRMSGAAFATISSILIAVKVHDPELYDRIVEFELKHT